VFLTADSRQFCRDFFGKWALNATAAALEQAWLVGDLDPSSRCSSHRGV